MPAKFREFLSEKLIDLAAESALDRQTMERSLESVPSQHRGRREALAAVRTAELFEAVVLWLGWRLQPRTFG